ncbi:MAG TPA: hypothetical protein VNB94_13810 [Mycobacteriales bacterium]|nr:hypothetical protein [Mycobacteriales bacterium]
MLTSITPLGERGRQRRWAATVTAYTVGSVAAGSLLGGLLGLLPDPPSRAAVGLLAAACLIAAVLDWRPGWLPTVRRQVNEDWLNAYRGWVCGAGYGLQLGLGVVTIVTTASVYVVLLAAALAGSWWESVLIGATFGSCRALPALLLRSVTTTTRLVALSRRLGRWATPAARTTSSSLALLGITCAVTAVAQ